MKTDFLGDHKHLKSGFIDNDCILAYITNLFLHFVLVNYPVDTCYVSGTVLDFGNIVESKTYMAFVHTVYYLV